MIHNTFSSQATCLHACYHARMSPLSAASLARVHLCLSAKGRLSRTTTRCATRAGAVGVHCFQRFMPPKGSKKAPSCLGAANLHNSGWRVVATVGGHTVHGPFRLQKRYADADLAQARSAQTQDEYCSILKQMRESAQSSSGDAHPVARPVCLIICAVELDPL